VSCFFRTDVDEITVDSEAIWKPFNPNKQEIKQEDADASNSCSGGPPPKRLRSVDTSIASPMSVGNPATPMSVGNPPTPNSYKPPTPNAYKPPTPNSYKPPTPANRPCTPSSTPGPKTPQSNTSMTSSSNDSKFAVPSPMSSMHPVSSQPQLLRQQSQPTSTNQNTPCNLTPAQGGMKSFLIRT
jgi:hypothetical protein